MVVNGVNVRLYRLTIWSAILLWRFFWPASIAAQEEPITLTEQPALDLT